MRTYVLIHTQAGRAGEVATGARLVPGVQSAEVVSGPYDVVVETEAVPLHDHHGHAVVQAIEALPGVIRAIACPVADHHRIWEMGVEPAALLEGATR